MPEQAEPTDVELKILKVLWEQPGATTRVIHNAVHADEEKNYSTTVKMLSVMLDKGLVRRDDSVRPQTFVAAVTRRRAQKNLVKQLVTKVFDGSATSLAMHALSGSRPSQEDLREIRQLLDELEGRS